MKISLVSRMLNLIKVVELEAIEETEEMMINRPADLVEEEIQGGCISNSKMIGELKKRSRARFNRKLWQKK